MTVVLPSLGDASHRHGIHPPLSRCSNAARRADDAAGNSAGPTRTRAAEHDRFREGSAPDLDAALLQVSRREASEGRHPARQPRPGHGPRARRRRLALGSRYDQQRRDAPEARQTAQRQGSPRRRAVDDGVAQGRRSDSQRPDPHGAASPNEASVHAHAARAARRRRRVRQRASGRRQVEARLLEQRGGPPGVPPAHRLLPAHREACAPTRDRASEEAADHALPRALRQGHRQEQGRRPHRRLPIGAAFDRRLHRRDPRRSGEAEERADQSRTPKPRPHPTQDQHRAPRFRVGPLPGRRRGHDAVLGSAPQREGAEGVAGPVTEREARDAARVAARRRLRHARARFAGLPPADAPGASRRVREPGAGRSTRDRQRRHPKARGTVRLDRSRREVERPAQERQVRWRHATRGGHPQGRERALPLPHPAGRLLPDRSRAPCRADRADAAGATSRRPTPSRHAPEAAAGRGREQDSNTHGLDDRRRRHAR